MLVRIHVASHADATFFTTGQSSKLQSVISAIRPLVFARLRDIASGTLVTTGEMVNAIRAQADESKKQQTLDASALATNDGVNIEIGKVEGGKGDLVTNEQEGWVCKMFLREDEDSSKLLMKQLKVVSKTTKRRPELGKRKRGGIINLEEYEESVAVTIGESDEEEQAQDLKPQIAHDYAAFSIYGRVLILLLSRRRQKASEDAAADEELWGPSSKEDEDETSKETADEGAKGGATRAGMTAWIGASQAMRVEEAGMDFEDK